MNIQVKNFYCCFFTLFFCFLSLQSSDVSQIENWLRAKKIKADFKTKFDKVSNDLINLSLMSSEDESYGELYRQVKEDGESLYKHTFDNAETVLKMILNKSAWATTIETIKQEAAFEEEDEEEAKKSKLLEELFSYFLWYKTLDIVTKQRYPNEDFNVFFHKFVDARDRLYDSKDLEKVRNDGLSLLQGLFPNEEILQIQRRKPLQQVFTRKNVLVLATVIAVGTFVYRKWGKPLKEFFRKKEKEERVTHVAT